MYRNNLLRQVDTGYIYSPVPATITTVRGLNSYRNGIMISGDAGLDFYDGQTIQSYYFLRPFDSSMILESASGYLYVAPRYNALASTSQIANSDLLVIESDTTANSSIKLLMVNNLTTSTNNFDLYAITNETQQTYAIVSAECNIGDMVTIDLNNGTVFSTIRGDINGFSYGAGITTMRILPGKNFVGIAISPFNTVADKAMYILWKQTFNSIFDGIRVQ